MHSFLTTAIYNSIHMYSYFPSIHPALISLHAHFLPSSSHPPFLIHSPSASFTTDIYFPSPRFFTLGLKLVMPVQGRGGGGDGEFR